VAESFRRFFPVIVDTFFGEKASVGHPDSSAVARVFLPRLMG
jgi:hypothetical protein